MANKTQIEKSLIEEMDLANLPEEKQQQLVNKMFEVVLQRIYVEAETRLSEEDRKTFDGMIDVGSQPEEVEKFLIEKIPDFEEMLKNILSGFREEMLKI